MNSQFTVTQKGMGLSRLGRIKCVHDDVITPCYVPVVPFLDGTDDSIRTENITKSYPTRPGLSQVLLHNKDGKLGPEQQRKLSTPLHSRFPHYTGAAFLDSGGFKLIRMDIEDMPAEEIFNIQAQLEGDIFFTLDYPIVDVMPFKMQVKRAKKSVENAIKALQLRKDRWGTKTDQPLVYVAVHGTSPQFIRDYLEYFFKLLKKHKLEDVPFGMAQGSLVPLKTKRHLVLEFIYTTKKVLIERGIVDQVPIHAFGMSGPLIPYLTLFGVDTFDSASYLLSAGNHQLNDPETLELVSAMKKDDVTEKLIYCARHNLDPNSYKSLKEAWNCNCNWCQKAQNAKVGSGENLIDFAHKIQEVVPDGWRENAEFLTYLKDRNFKMLDNLYVHMICHNLTALHTFTDKMNTSLKLNKFDEFFFNHLTKAQEGGQLKRFKRNLRFLKSIAAEDKTFCSLVQKNLGEDVDLGLDENLFEKKDVRVVNFNENLDDVPLHPGKMKVKQKKLAVKKQHDKDYAEYDLI